MSKATKVTATVFALTVIYYGNLASAASGSGKTSAAAGSDTVSAAADTRLRAKFEDEAVVEGTAPEFHADYRVKKGVPQLQVRVENLAVGTVVDVLIENLKIGTATVEVDGEETEAALDFKKGAWPVGLPMTLTAGMMVRVFSGTTLLFEAPFAAR